MAEIRQGYLDDYTQNTSGNIGIGTSSASDAKLEIVGGTTTQELNVTGIASFTSASGFIEKHTTYTEDVNITSGDSGTLSGEIIVGAGLTMIVGTAATASQGSVDSLKVSNMFQPPSGGTNQRPAGKPGALFYNFDFKTIEFFDGNSWRQVDNTLTRGRSVHAGGANPVGGSFLPTISSFEHATQGHASYFGDLTVGGQGNTAFSSRIYGFNAGRRTPSTNPDNIIDYVTISSGGNAIDFGDMTNQRRLGASFSSSTRGIMAGGITPSRVNTIDYVQMSTKGDAVDFGDTTELLGTAMNGISNGVRGVYNGGQDGSSNISKNIQFLTISSKGNALKFGELTNKRRSTGTCSNSTRGVFAAGYNGGTSLTSIEFITISSEGNGTDFGELARGAGITYASGSASQTRAFFSGGYYMPLITAEIDYLLFSSGGNTIPFGDLSVPTESGSACSDSHGGLGGF